MRASRGAERTPLPIRSTKRMRRTWGQARREGDQGTDDGREAVAREDEGLAARGAIGKAPGDDLHGGGRRLRDPFDQPERDRGRPRKRREKDRQEREDHLGRGVCQE